MKRRTSVAFMIRQSTATVFYYQRIISTTYYIRYDVNFSFPSIMFDLCPSSIHLIDISIFPINLWEFSLLYYLITLFISKLVDTKPRPFFFVSEIVRVHAVLAL